MFRRQQDNFWKNESSIFSFYQSKLQYTRTHNKNYKKQKKTEICIINS